MTSQGTSELRIDILQADDTPGHVTGSDFWLSGGDEYRLQLGTVTEPCNIVSYYNSLYNYVMEKGRKLSILI